MIQRRAAAAAGAVAIDSASPWRQAVPDGEAAQDGSRTLTVAEDDNPSRMVSVDYGAGDEVVVTGDQVETPHDDIFSVEIDIFDISTWLYKHGIGVPSGVDAGLNRLVLIRNISNACLCGDVRKGKEKQGGKTRHDSEAHQSLRNKMNLLKFRIEPEIDDTIYLFIIYEIK